MHLDGAYWGHGAQLPKDAVNVAQHDLWAKQGCAQRQVCVFLGLQGSEVKNVFPDCLRSQPLYMGCMGIGFQLG